VLSLDVCDEASIEAAVARVIDDHGAVGALVNNAGYGQEGTIEEVPMAEVRRQFETNVFGLVELTKRVLPGMRAQGWGRIVNLSSMGGKVTLPGGGYYHATKYAVEAISDALRFEAGRFGIDVVVVEPGPIATEFGTTALASVEPLRDPESPYARFNGALAQRIVDAYEGGLSRFSAPPEAVARVIEKAISARRPRTRYRVTVAARAMLTTRKLVPDRGWDLLMRAQFPAKG
jgi:NAD(P)-dependent dehydrogenase (short-subunit alcohol dehydrogenase family)